MMNQLRKGVGGFTAKLLLALLVLSFVVWGIADGFGTAGSPNAVLTAGDTDVTTNDYQQAYNQAVNRVAMQLQRRPTAEEQAGLNLESQVLRQLASVAVLDEEARRLGVGLSDTGLAQRIADEPAFKDSSGNYSAATARAALQRAGLTEEQYAAEERRMSRRVQLMSSVTGGLALPQVFVDALGNYNGERRSLSYVTLAPNPSDQIADPDDATIQDFYDDVAEDYAVPELRSFSYVSIVPSELFDPATITDAEIEAEYNENVSDFTTAEQRQIQQIVFPDRAAADAAAAELAAGKSFDVVAQEAGRSEGDIALGLRTADQIPDTVLRDAAFALELNRPSGVVDGLFGPAILRVTEIRPASVQPLDAVREDIRQQLAAVQANQKATEAYTTIQDAVASGASLSEAAQNAGLPLVTIDGMDQKGRNADGVEFENLTGGSDLITAVFLAQPGIAQEAVNFAQGSYAFFDLNSIAEAHERPLDEIRDRLVADWKSDEADRQLEARAQQLADRVEGGEPLATIAAELGSTVQTASAITRATGPAQIGQPATLAAFQGPTGHVGIAPANTTGNWMILQVDEVAPPADPSGDVQPEMVDRMADLAQNDLLQSFVGLLQREIPVSYNQNAIDAVRGFVR